MYLFRSNNLQTQLEQFQIHDHGVVLVRGRDYLGLVEVLGFVYGPLVVSNGYNYQRAATGAPPPGCNTAAETRED